jgi:hypothetical protein
MSGTTADIYIYSSKSSPALRSEGRGGLEDDLEEFLSAAGEVTGGGAGNTGWNIDLHFHDASELEQWLERLAGFLRDWGVPDDTFLDVFVTVGPRRVDVFPKENS